MIFKVYHFQKPRMGVRARRGLGTRLGDSIGTHDVLTTPTKKATSSGSFHSPALHTSATFTCYYMEYLRILAANIYMHVVIL